MENFVDIMKQLSWLNEIITLVRVYIPSGLRKKNFLTKLSQLFELDMCIIVINNFLYDNYLPNKCSTFDRYVNSGHQKHFGVKAFQITSCIVFACDSASEIFHLKSLFRRDRECPRPCSFARAHLCKVSARISSKFWLYKHSNNTPARGANNLSIVYYCLKQQQHRQQKKNFFLHLFRH